MRRSIVVFELNEVPWEIVDDYVAARPASALARVLAGSRCYTSMTADRGHLSPWTTWPTLHRGVNDEQHMIASFGQDRSLADQRFPPIWSLLHEAGVSVGVCGTLHSYPAPDDLDAYAFYLPDAFASEPVAHIFAHQLRRSRPRFSTFFTQSRGLGDAPLLGGLPPRGLPAATPPWAPSGWAASPSPSSGPATASSPSTSASRTCTTSRTR
jgi:hypothetical protein